MRASAAATRLGVGAAAQRRRLHDLQLRNAAARTDVLPADLLQRTGGQIPRAAAARAQLRRAHARAERRHTAAHAVAEQQRARLCVEFEHARVASAARRQRREVVDTLPALPGRAILGQVDLQRDAVDIAGRKLDACVRAAVGVADDRVRECAHLLDDDRVHANPRELQRANLARRGVRTDAQPGDEPRLSLRIVEPRRLGADPAALVRGARIGSDADQRFTRRHQADDTGLARS